MESVVLGPAPSDALVDRAVVAWLVLATAVLGVVFLVTLGLNRYVVDIPDLKRTFDFALETNVPTWWNTVLLAGVAASFLLAARLHPGDALPTRRSLLVAALAVAYLSLDEAAQLHELAGEPTSSLLDDAGIDLPTYAWLVPGTIVAAGAVLVYARWCRTLPAPVRRGTTIGLLMYGTGALGVEAFNGWVRDRSEHAYAGGTLVEEWLEMGACIVTLHATTLLVALRGDDDGPTLRWRGI